MTIRDATYQLCKSVWQSHTVHPIRDYLRSLTSGGPHTAGKPTAYPSFNYIARQQRAQLLGYLLVDQHRSAIAQGPFPVPIPALSVQHRQLLAGAHKEIQRLNERCVQALVKRLPQYSKAVDPYSPFDYTEPPGTAPEDLLGGPELEEVVNSFQNHPALALALSTAGIIRDDLDPEQIAEIVITRLEEKLIDAGVTAAHRDIDEPIRTQGTDSPERTALRHLSAVLGIRDSLRNINQLIYQAILSEKLSVVDEDNVISITRHGHIAGAGVVVQVQTGKALGSVDIMNLVLLMPSISDSPIEQLGKIERIRFSTSRDLGTDVELQLREVDEHLNSFGGLLKSL